MREVLSSEWLKLRSVNSTRTAIGAAAAMVLAGVLWTFYVSGVAEDRGGMLRAAAPEAGFLPLTQVSLALIGVLAITSEHATGTIRASLVAVPKRSTLLLAKTAVVTMTTFAAGSAILLVTYASSRLIAGDRRLGFNDASFADDLPMLAASALSVTVLALVGLGLGFATRSTAAAVVSVVALLFVLPGIANYLPSPWNAQVSALLLPNLVPQIAGRHLSTRLGEGFLPPWAAAIALVAYAVGALAVGLHLLRKRDA
ncbi:ABC transporter permease [Nonomuraea sp. NPDC005983]|uniref:ABC transporter permease n=1 Tax=Nonomuraea sp. NPDC005983 TaxID=3155595 RepID=UPI0033AF0661